ncbi:hypothetical protein VPHD485_0013 [Vibrio phage D485]
MSNSDKTDLVYRHLDFSGASKIFNLPNADTAGAPLPKSQIEALLAEKQDNTSAGSGISFDGTEINVDLATAGSDFSGFSLTETDHTSLNGTYTRLNYRAYLDYSGTNLDLTYGGDFNVYYKDNGAGVWAIVARREIDGSAGTSDSGTWMAALTTIDPTSITTDVTSFIPDYQAVDSDTCANADVQDEAGFRSPAEGYVLVTLSYGTGSTPAGLKFDNNKLALDFANAIADAASTKVFPSSIIKTYIDEQISDAKDLANHPFSNAIAQIAGNPLNAQSAFEKLAAENDAQDTLISGIQTVNTTQTSHISATAQAVGVALGQTTMGTFTNDILTDNSDLKTVLEAAAGEIDEVHSQLNGHLGITDIDTGMGTMVSTIYTDDGDAKTLFEEAGSAIESLQVGAGAFWAAVDYHHHEDSHALPAGFGDGSTDVGTLVIDPTGSNLTVAELETGDRILVIGDGTDPVTGIYVVNADNSTQRATDAQASGDFTTNKTVNIINGGSHAGATYAYVGASDPTLGSDPLPFEFKQGTNVGDTTITEAKLSIVLAQKVNDKTDKETATFDINTSDGNGGFTETIAHTLGEDYIAQVADAATGEVRTNFEVVKSDNQVVVNSNISVTGLKIVIIG